MLRYCTVYNYSSLRIAIIPFLYDLKGAFDSIQMKGQRLFLTGKMTGQTLFLKKKMTGQGLFSREKMKGQRLFSRRKNSVCPAHVPIIFAPSLRVIAMKSKRLCHKKKVTGGPVPNLGSPSCLEYYYTLPHRTGRAASGCTPKKF